MTETPDQGFTRLLSAAKTDENIVGFFSVGSRGKGYEGAFSDYDLFMIVKDAVEVEYKRKYGDEIPGIDLSVCGITTFSTYAAWQSKTHWDRYSFSRVKTLVDKTDGRIQELIDEKGSVPEDKRTDFISDSLDAYVNSFYRSVKSYRKRDAVGVRLSAAASIPYLLNALFALHARPAPFADYLARELKERPLEKFPWSSNRFLDALLEILRNGDLTTQQELARAVEAVFRREGHGQIFDNWRGEDKWAAAFESDFEAGSRV